VPTQTRWSLVAILMTAGVIAAAQVGKAAIAAPLLQRELALSLVAVSWIVSAYAALGAVGGLATGWGVSRIGVWRSLIGGMTTIGITSLAGAFATNGLTLFAIRIVEGCGLLAVAVAVPTMLRMITAPKDRDVVMTTWGAYMPAGTALMMLAGPLLAPLGWQSLWIANGIIALLYTPLLAATVPAAHTAAEQGLSIGPLLRRPGALLIAATFGLYTFQFTAISGLLPDLLVDRRGLSIAAAGAIATGTVVANTLGNLSAGALLRWGVPLWAIIVAAFVSVGLTSFAIFSPHVPVFAVAVLAAASLGITGAIPASIFAAAPRIIHDAGMLAMMLGLINQISNLGQLLGPAVLGGFAQQFGWALAPVLFVIVATAGIAIGLTLRPLLQSSSPGDALPARRNPTE
jgi:DHA1 family inner membrane transport protein